MDTEPRRQTETGFIHVGEVAVLAVTGTVFTGT
jgi:hypothetical protein